MAAARLLRRSVALALLALLTWLLPATARAAGLDDAAGRTTPTALLLDAATAPVHEAWPVVRLLLESPGQPLTLDQVRHRESDFRPPTGAWANLGQQREGVWLRVPLRAAGSAGAPAVAWLFDVDYTPLQQVDVWLVRGGQLVQQARLGAALRFDERPVPSRTPALLLQLAPGQDEVLYLRVHSNSALVLPMAFSTPAHYQAREARRQVVQGMLAGLALALLVYSLAHWASLRDPLFAFYALMLSGTTLFFVHLYGIGQQHLWPDSPPWQAMASPMAMLLALSGAGPFVIRALGQGPLPRWARRGLLTGAAVSGITLLAGLAGLAPYPLQRVVASGDGLFMALLAVLASWQAARRGDPMARWMLLGWCTYLLGGITVVGLVYGLLPGTLWTLHGFQAGWMIEILAWLRVLGLNIAQVRRQAERTELEKQTLQSLASTDALTGLPNRRGLMAALAQALPLAGPTNALAVFLLDLDGFKPVNDRLGHDAGDALLVQVGQRLKSQLRGSDVVARLGGDEFVILAAGLGGQELAAADAQRIGSKLLRAFDAPFDVLGQTCRVGLTIGYALAPQDGSDANDLLKRADAAMYAGKQAGRHCLRRGGASAGLVGA